MNTPSKSSGNLYLDGCETSREAFDEKAKRIANVLSAAGVEPDQPVAILMRNDVNYLNVIEACRYLGSPYVALNWHASTPELIHILDDSKAKALIGHASLTSQFDADLDLDIEIFSISDPVELAEAYALDVTQDSLHTDLESLVEEATAIGVEPKRFRGLFAYTSGSTGRPKGIKRVVNNDGADPYLTYAQLSKNLLMIEPGDRFYTAAPVYHSAPCGLSGFCIAGGEADLYIASKFDAEGFLADIAKYKITHCYIVPTMMVRLLKLPREVRDKYDVSSLRYGISSGSPWPADVKQDMIEWFGSIFYESYGSSELGFMTLISSAEALQKPGSVGKVLPGGSIKILDDNHCEMQAGETGSIFVNLPTFGDFSYTNAEGDLGGQRFQGFSTVGDVGYLDEDDYLFINGRNKEMIISGGANIFPAEIESELIKMPEVLDCAVFGAPHDEFGEMVAAVQTSRADLSVDEIRHFLESRIARFKLPKKLDIHQTLPREDSGKIFKQRLREPYWEGRKVKI